MATLQLPSIKPSVITPLRATPLIFSHPAIDRAQPFVIDTGASSIKWPYKLNVKVTPTYAGEVVQILSVFVDKMVLSGQTRDAEQLRSIYSWFLRYMQIAGLADRNQQAMTFQYPERGWQFLIQPTAIPEFTYNRDLLAVEWKMEAEVVQDDAPLSGYTMNGFTKAAFDPSLWDVGFNAEDPRVNPLSPFNQDPSTAQNLGDNFQALIGAWSSGDFAHWAFDATQSPKANSLKNSKEYYTEIFGTDFLTKSKSAANSGSAPYTGPANPQGEQAIAYMISQAFEKHGVPGKLGVAIAMAESGLDPDEFQDPVGAPTDPGGYGGTPTKGQTGVGLFQTTNVSGGEQLLADQAVANFPAAITKVFPAIQQAEYAAQRAAADTHSTNLGEWGWNFQRPNDKAGYITEINGLLDRAQALIDAGKKLSGAGYGGKAIEIAHTQLGNGETPPGSNNTPYGAEYGLNGEPWCAMFATWCFKRAGSSFHYASVADIVLDARAGKNGLVILNQPEPGCLACFDFDSAHAMGEPPGTVTNDSGHEHVTFFEFWVHAGDTFTGLGGNQGDKVTEAQFNNSNVIAYIRVTQ